jgi:hypothetical protein
MNSATHDYTLCGWRLRSALELPELAPWTGDDRDPELVFELGEVPAEIDATFQTPVVQANAAGTIRFAIDGVADYLVEDGDRIVIAPHLPADSPDIRLFLLGTGLGFLCHQRGLLPIHAAAIDVDGRAVMIAGASGAGKSTLAAAFMRRGFRILSDDVAPLTIDRAEPVILPSLKRIRLWHDSAQQAAWPVDMLEPCREDLAKFSHPLEAAHADAPLRPAALIHLAAGVAGDDAITLKRLRGAPAVEAMRQQTYRWRTLTGLLGRMGALQRVGAAAPLIPLHFELTRPVRYKRLDDTIDAIVQAVRAGS